MKFGQLLIGVLLGGVLGFGLTTYFAGTRPPAGPAPAIGRAAAAAKWAWPDSLDAVRAAPANHKVVYEDSTVRILQVLLAGHRAEPVHTHQWKSIMWIAKPAVPCTIYQYKVGENGKFVAADSVTIPQMTTNVGQHIDAEGPTGIQNLGNDDGVAYRVEFKKDFQP
ncbi:hypothetical protein Q5H93_12015 [Hymenobacter sp. ASUV-10]|uniref:Uncharacterized protein n=1 Tax=Hymenobacter aranciens TaxID=3063996 RepID=A0ABT9BB05_9BACT|nr:hypothetical protein [Hymenobacter sp. ASUV-10]MDO7875459.1 hypothetical protein [Hymenobacter sp. ASUV-10]